MNKLMCLTTERKNLISIARRRMYDLRSYSARSCYNNNHHLKTGREYFLGQTEKMCTVFCLFSIIRAILGNASVFRTSSQNGIWWLRRKHAFPKKSTWFSENRETNTLTITTFLCEHRLNYGCNPLVSLHCCCTIPKNHHFDTIILAHNCIAAR